MHLAIYRYILNVPILFFFCITDIIHDIYKKLVDKNSCA